MTGPEREEFRALRDEIRDGFEKLEEKMDVIGTRVHSLELTRAEHQGGWEAEQRNQVRVIAERRWRIGLLVSVVVTAGIGILNLVRGM